ncbi:hypothetical protein [Polyangium jinanense]|uniref:Uncharacterized protein n=1 Tax=Polyangium jinanense TaxID=2829994 RepID=A0A9X4AWS3_9BACT|nr:hypothetical protein [Polyangium jinanense]MDC3987653.1 hypothetical protein [Polyangium jinanense]
MMENPFQAIHADAWDPAPIDVSSINERASSLVRAHIEQLRDAGAREGTAARSTSILLLGPAGIGKTHLFTRLRKQVGPRAVFVHTRPEVGVDPSPRHVLSATLRSLRQPVIQQQHRQIDVIVGAMLATLQGGRPRFPLSFIDDCSRQPPDTQREILSHAVAQTEDRFPDTSARYLEHLLALPFADRMRQRALFAWLSGDEPSQSQLDMIGERAALREDDLILALRTLGVVAAFGAPIVLVFDQLENLAEEEGKTGRIIRHARLVSELRDTVRGLVIVQMALDAVWMQRIHPVLHASMRDRLEEKIEHLALPTPEQRRELIERWRSALPEEEKSKPFPYPFSTRQVDAWLAAPGMTPRMLMQSCGEAYLRRTLPEAEEAEPVDTSPDERLAVAWQEHLGRARKRIDEAAAQAQGVAAESIRAGLLAALTVAQVKAETGETEGAPALRIRMADGGCEMLFVQQAHHTSLARVLRAAIALADERKVLLLREQAFAIPPTWKEVHKLLAAFTGKAYASFLPIEREALARLLAVERLLGAARSQDLSDDAGKIIPYDTVMDWARRTLGCNAWGPVEALFGTTTAPVSVPSAPRPPEPPPTPADPNAAPPRPREEEASPRATTKTPADGPVLRELRKLRVASIDRLVREVRACDPMATRASIMEELAKLPIKRFGGAIIALEEPWR